MGKKTDAAVPSTDDTWQAQSDLRTLAEARAIKKDPERLKRAQAEAQKQMLAAAGAAAELEDDD